MYRCALQKVDVMLLVFGFQPFSLCVPYALRVGLAMFESHCLDTESLASPETVNSTPHVVV